MQMGSELPGGAAQNRQDSHPEDGVGNAVWSLLVLLAAPLIGSAASALVWLSSGAGVLLLAARPALFRVPRGVIVSALAFSALLAAEAVSGVVHWHGGITFAEITQNLVFLGLLPLFVLFKRDRARLLGDMRVGAPYFALLAFAIALVQQFGGMRPEGGAGNPGVFAIVCSLVFVFCSERLFARDAPMWRGGIALDLMGFASSAGAVLMSGSRALWPCLALVPIVLVVASGKVSRNLTVAGAIVLATVVGVAAFGPPRQRIVDAISDVELMETGNFSTSFGKRLIVWKIGLEAGLESPWLGQGPDAPRRLMRERSVAVSGMLLGFNHFHNVLLNEWARAGVPGVLAISAMFLVPLRATWKNRKRDRVALAAFQLIASCQIVFLASGMFNILFDHDIVDAVFVAVHAFGLYLSFGGPPTQRGSAIRRT